MWHDGGPNRERGRWADKWAEQRVDFPCRELPRLLLGVQRDLVGFLNALAEWAEQTGIGPRGTALVEMIDQNFAATAPLELPAS